MVQTEYTPVIAMPVLNESAGQIASANKAFAILDALTPIPHVLDADLTTPPGSESDGDVYIPAATATGDWAGHEDDLAIVVNGSYEFVTPLDRWVAWLEDEGCYVYYNGSAWVYIPPKSVESGITASTTQSQGQEPLTKEVNQISTCGNANDVVTLIAAFVGAVQVVINDGANTLQIFPASGDSIDGGSVDASTTLATGKRAIFYAYDATDWSKIVGA